MGQEKGGGEKIWWKSDIWITAYSFLMWSRQKVEAGSQEKILPMKWGESRFPSEETG